MAQERFDDDEDVELQSDSETVGLVSVKPIYYSKPVAALVETEFNVLVELMGRPEVAENRFGLDIVVLLDVSRRMMMHNRFGVAKYAINYLVHKLSPMDRLSVVTFSSRAKRICALRKMTPDAKDDVLNKVFELETSPGTNFTAGLEEAVRLAKDRKFTKGRKFAVILMSHGKPHPLEADGSQVPIDDVPVYTIGLGTDVYPEVLYDIAERSNGHAFIPDNASTEEYNLACEISQWLAELQTFFIEDITLIITPQNPSITLLEAYEGCTAYDEINGSITMSLGDIEGEEIREIMVCLVLDKVEEPEDTDILKISYSYKIGGKLINNTPITVIVNRMDAISSEIEVGNACQNVVNLIKEAKEMVDDDDENLLKAWLMVSEAKTKLEGDEIDQTDPMIKGLQSELEQLLKFMNSSDNYNRSRFAFFVAAELYITGLRVSFKSKAYHCCMFPGLDQKIYHTIPPSLPCPPPPKSCPPPPKSCPPPPPARGGSVIEIRGTQPPRGVTRGN